MTHKRLLDKLAYTPHTDPNGKYMYRALRSVVELHKPIQDKKLWCEGCRVEDDDWYSIEYPCPTIQAIEAAFND